MKLEEYLTPVSLTRCDNCGGTIWKQGEWRQCPDCGALTTAYDGLFTHETEAVPDFVEAVNKQKAKLEQK